MEGTSTACVRCGMALQVGPPPNPGARPIRRARTPHGLCATCAAAACLRSDEWPSACLLAESGPNMLLAPHIQEAFGAVLKAGGSDVRAEQIDWQKMVNEWELPWAGEMRP